MSSRLLDQAAELIYGDRADTYGPWQENAYTFAELASAFLGEQLRTPITSLQATALMALLKIMRISQDPEHRDSWIDLAGYAGCAGKILDESEASCSTPSVTFGKQPAGETSTSFTRPRGYLPPQ